MTEPSNNALDVCDQSNPILPDDVRRVNDENIATPKYHSSVVSGINTYLLLTDNQDEDTFASHDEESRSGITLDLGRPTCFNNINMKLREWGQPYVIEISLDNEKWYKIIDYSQYFCRFDQILYFPEQVARYIRFVGVYKTFIDPLEIINLQVYLKTHIPEVCNQIVCLGENVATSQMGARITPWDLTELSKKTISREIRLAQPYIISCIRIRWHVGGHKYIIKTSVDSANWEAAAEGLSQDYSQWQTISFKEKTVIYVEITCSIHALKNFTLDDFQCFYNKNSAEEK